MRFLLFGLTLTALGLLLDLYVYRRWRRFVREQRWPELWHRLYAVLIPLAALLLPAYFLLWRLGEVEQPQLRSVFSGLWVLWYLPKLLLAPFLLLAHLAGLMGRLWQILRRKPEPAGTAERRRFLRTAGWALAGVPFVLTGRGLLRDTYAVTLYRETLRFPNLPRAFDGLRIVQLSDLHAGSYLTLHPVEEALALCRELKPDLLVFTGDFVNGDDAELDRTAPLLRALAALRPPLGAFGIRGNHEHYADPERVSARMEAYGFRMLVNAHHVFRIDGEELQLIGTDNTGMRQRFADLPRAMAGLRPEGFRILLTHDPTFWERSVMGRVDIPLTLAGHTHGGQLGIEWGPVRMSTSSLVYTRWAGLYREGDQYLYINRGLGTTGPPIRLGIPPEVTEITLRRL